MNGIITYALCIIALTSEAVMRINGVITLA